MTSRHRDAYYLGEALRLAKKGQGATHPNPMVGAVILRRGRIVGRGYHRRAGLPHAEIEALAHAGVKANGATLYVTLEPCNHFGRTPPCTDAIIRAGIRRVVCVHVDPNPKVSGRGIARLTRAGIAVSVGIREKEARELNEQFCTFHEQKRPFVALKFAVSLDGKLSTRSGDSKWITNELARAFARRLRGNHQAVLVGVNTVIRDDPHLGVRRAGRTDPLRIILDPHLRIPLSARVLRDKNVIIAATPRAPRKKREQLARREVSVMTFPRAPIPIRLLLRALHKKGIISVFVEGGGETLGHFVDAGIADKVYAFYAPLLIGGKSAASIGAEGVGRVTDALRFTQVAIRRFEDTILVIGSVTAS